MNLLKLRCSMKGSRPRQTSNMPRCFPLPRSIQEGTACFIARDHNKLALSLISFADI